MKNLLLLVLVSCFCNAQSTETEYTLTKEKGLTNYIVLPFEGKTQSELYKKALQWFEVYYKNPKEVVKGTIENDYIRFTGAKYGIVCLNALGRNCYECRYTIEISFKDGKIKFDLTNLEYYSTPSQYTPGGWMPINFESMDGYFNKKGEWRSTFKYYPEIPGHINEIMNDFAKFINSENIPSKSDW